jgi:hypothetical protein
MTATVDPNSITNPPKLGQGDVRIELGNETFVMRPSINAMQIISSKYGGLNDAMDKIARTDIHVIADVISLGIGGNKFSTAKGRQDLMQRMYEAGITDDTGGCAERAQMYILMLMRGGRPLPTQVDTPDSGEDVVGNVPSSRP